MSKTLVEKGIPLGQQMDYPDQYDASILFPIPRQQAREKIAVQADSLPFKGEDQWTAYEISWLDAKGKPQVAIGHVSVPCDSENMVESKSFKLYLNSFNQSRFASMAEVESAIQKDISAVVGKEVNCRLLSLNEITEQGVGQLEGRCIDGIEIDIDQYHPDASILSLSDEVVDERLVSHLLKSNCRITSQPDWASIQITYHGRKIDEASLLTYLIGFRNHDEFHEPCVEKIYTDLMRIGEFEKLSVYARYTRRGGLDINPFRSNFEAVPANIRLARQ